MRADCWIAPASRLPVPVTVGERTDEATGQRWITADVTLAPLAPSDYLVEVGDHREVG